MPLKLSTLTTLCMVNALVMIFIHMSESPLMMKNKTSNFECGFLSLSPKKISFSTNFIMIAMMFLIFDVEISFLAPFMLMSKTNLSSLMIMPTTFLMLLIIILLKEWKQGSLEWNK